MPTSLVLVLTSDRIASQLEALPWEELNEEQRQKVERKADVQAEISRLTKLVRQQDYV